MCQCEQHTKMPDGKPTFDFGGVRKMAHFQSCVHSLPSSTFLNGFEGGLTSVRRAVQVPQSQRRVSPSDGTGHWG